jgi:hypothetical protein
MPGRSCPAARSMARKVVLAGSRADRAARGRQLGRAVYVGLKNILNQEHPGDVERNESAQVLAGFGFNPGFVTNLEKLSPGAASTSAPPFHVLCTYKPLSWSSGTTLFLTSSEAIHFLR